MRWTALIALAIAVTAWPAAGQDDRRIELEIGEDTTFFTGPVRDDGTIDYIAALNAHYGEGIANEDNAFVLLAQVFPELDRDGLYRDGRYLEHLLEQLGIDAAEDRVRLTRWLDYAESQGLDDQELHQILRAVRDGPWLPDAYPHVAAWLALNDPAFEVIQTALQRGQYFSPFIVTSEDETVFSAPLAHLSEIREIARQLAVRIFFAAASDDHEEAVRLLGLLDRLGIFVADDPTFIGKLTAIGVRSMACDAVAMLCERGELGHEQALALSRSRMHTPDSLSIAETMHYIDRSMGLEQTILLYLKVRESIKAWEQDQGEEAPDFGELMDINQALRQMNGYYDLIVRCLNETDAEAKDALMDQFESEVYDSYGEPYLSRTIFFCMFSVITGQGFPTDVFTEKITLKLAQVLMPGFATAERTLVRSQARRVVDAAALALLGYRDVHGTLPESLDALVPTYFDEVPMDPYADGPLVYRDNDDGSALVYSIGEDLEDDSGVDDYREGDIAIHVGPPPGGGDWDTGE